MYGITNDDRQYIDSKLNKQKTFLKNFKFEIAGEEIDLLDNVYSANINPKKYFSEINNRVNSMFNYAKDFGLQPVFVTITLPPYLHYKHNKNAQNDGYNNGMHYCPYTKDKMYVYDEDIGAEKININKNAKFLSKLWASFTSLQVIRKMKKDTGHGLIYFRVYEPMSSGIPHIHAMLFVPVNYVNKIKKKFYEHFKKIGSKQLDYKHTWYNKAGGAIAYIMKYINKTFRNAETDTMDDAAYWFIKNRIIRFCSSRTLAPLAIYRKIRYRFKDNHTNDYIYVSKLVKIGQIDTLFNKTQIEFKYYCPEEGDIVEEIVWSKSFIEGLHLESEIPKWCAKIDEDGKKYYINKNQSKQVNKMEYKKEEPKKKTKFEVIKDFEVYILDIENNTLVEKMEIVSQMTDLRLVKHFRKIDNNLDGINLHHYGLVKNEMIKRGLFDGEILSVNLYNTDI